MPDNRRTLIADPQQYPQLVGYPDLSYTPLDQIGVNQGGMALDNSPGMNPVVPQLPLQAPDRPGVRLDQSSPAAWSAPEYVNPGDDSYRSPLSTIPEGLGRIGSAIGEDLSGLGSLIGRGVDAITPDQSTIDNLAMRFQRAHAIGQGTLPLYLQEQALRENQDLQKQALLAKREVAARQLQAQQETMRQNQWEDVFKVIGNNNLTPPQQMDMLKALSKTNPYAHQAASSINEKLIGDYKLVQNDIGMTPEQIMNGLKSGNLTWHDLGAQIQVAKSNKEAETKALAESNAKEKKLQGIITRFRQDPNSLNDTELDTVDQFFKGQDERKLKIQELQTRMKGNEIDLAAKQNLPQVSPSVHLPNGQVQQMSFDPTTGQRQTFTGTPAPTSVTNVNMKQEGAFEDQIGKLQAKSIADTQVSAKDAASMIRTIHQGKQLLDSGVITGVGAEYRLKFGQAIRQLGFNYGKTDIENTQAFVANMAGNVAKQIKEFGAGTGLSDADREYATKMAGGDITLDRKSIEKILDINEKAARNVIKLHNKSVSGIKSIIPLGIEEPPEYTAPSKSLSPQEFVETRTTKDGRRLGKTKDGKIVEIK